MRKAGTLFCSLFFLCATAHAQQQTPTPAATGPQLLFVKGDTTCDLGGVPKGAIAPYEFEIKNTGGAPLIISGVKPTSPDVQCKWPSKPIKPGKKSYITISYAANGDEGSFRPIDISIASNASINPSIHLTGAIIPAGSPYTPTKAPSAGGGRRGR